MLLLAIPAWFLMDFLAYGLIATPLGWSTELTRLCHYGLTLYVLLTCKFFLESIDEKRPEDPSKARSRIISKIMWSALSGLTVISIGINIVDRFGRAEEHFFVRVTGDWNTARQDLGPDAGDLPYDAQPMSYSCKGIEFADLATGKLVRASIPSCQWNRKLFELRDNRGTRHVECPQDPAMPCNGEVARVTLNSGLFGRHKLVSLDWIAVKNTPPEVMSQALKQMSTQAVVSNSRESFRSPDTALRSAAQETPGSPALPQNIPMSQLPEAELQALLNALAHQPGSGLRQYEQQHPEHKETVQRAIEHEKARRKKEADETLRSAQDTYQRRCSRENSQSEFCTSLSGWIRDSFPD
ncbi:hypothetical protein Q9Q94_13605 [Uliginosibacterium sp. 31-16]|uniref:hypothetical protein n=1 Tax=Uliginosibacterium sp. 31-16 TaxID=3068315 RepID=UPI00273EAF0F|nr:hypothetical protein [Uliginosibacterium sp. 31-16]MDP5240575.1 hypothetical protein [Uliginosibacterium sp. 31-16]